MSNKCIEHYLRGFSFSILVRALSAEQMHQPEHILIDQVKNKHGPMGDGALQPQVVPVPTGQMSHSLLDISRVSGNF